jgi:alpha-glucuronidase
MLHACFSLLEDYVEIELSWGSKKYRDAEKGLENLDYTISYNDKLPENHTVWDRMPDHQVEAAKEAKELYLWWQDYKKNDYGPVCPIDAGLDVLREKWKEENPEEAKAWKIWSDATHTFQERRRKEADENLARLIAIRHSLWT